MTTDVEKQLEALRRRRPPDGTPAFRKWLREYRELAKRVPGRTRPAPTGSTRRPASGPTR